MTTRYITLRNWRHNAVRGHVMFPKEILSPYEMAMGVRDRSLFMPGTGGGGRAGGN